MGRESTPKKLTDSLRSQIPGQEQSVAREVRRLYLTEYARRWQDFLDSIHSINSAGEEGSSGLAYDLQVLRTLASPDSPLMRLGKAVVEQTTLVPPPDPQARQKQLAQRASGNSGKVVQTAKLFQDIHPEERLEKTLVDDRFAALREVIVGRADGGQSGGGTMQIASLLTMLNEYYTQLTIADSALAAGTLPARITAADKLQLEAAKLPAPLKNILLDLTKQGTRKINAGTGDVLNTQMEAMMGDDCRDAIDGRYPFADSPQEVSAEDFNRIFASGGVLDAFWSKQLAPLADIGKFISGDPISLKGGINLYAYAPNPLSWIDPLGLKCWDSARRDYWKAEAKAAPKGMYSPVNMLRMRLGLAPKIRVREFHFKTRTERVRNVSLELNHRHWPQRDGKHVDIPYNLEKVTPWEHAAKDPYRYPGSELLEILQGIGNYKGF